MLNHKKLAVGALLIFVLLVANTVHLSGLTAGNAKRTLVRVWALNCGAVRSIVRTQVRPGEGPLLVVAGPGAVMLVGDDGKQRRRDATPGPLVALATGDLTGDGVDEIVTLVRSGADTRVAALDGDLKVLWSTPLPATAEPSRVLLVDLDGDRLRDVVLAFQGGLMQALTSLGKPLWSWEPDGAAGSEDGQVRGLDDAKAKGGQRRVAMARRDGLVVLLDGRGQPLWSERMESPVRRLRVAELGDGSSSLLIGREDGLCWRVRDTGTGAQSTFRGEALVNIAEPITEIRTLEADGQPQTREVVLGGKSGSVLVVGAGSTSVRAKISALGAADIDGDGRDELFVGTETGELHLLTAQGSELARLGGQGKLEAFAAVPANGGSRLIVVGSDAGLTAYRYEAQGAPVWYRPAAAAVVGALGLVVVVFGLARLRALPAAEPPTADLPGARRARLEQAWKQVAALMEGGQAKPEDAQERLAQLRLQIEAADREAGRSTRPVLSSPPPPRRAK